MSRSLVRRTAPLAVLGVLAITAACGGGQDKAKASDEALDCSAAPAASGEPPKIRIAYGPAAEEPVWLMEAKADLSENQGKSYELELTKYDDSEKKLVGYQAGEVDAVVAPTPSMVVGTAKGALDLVTLFTVMEEGSEDGFGTSFYVAGDSGIDEVSDLKGKTIGINDFRSLPDFLARMGLEKAGLTKDDVKFVTMPFPAQLEALNSGLLDAAAMVEPFATLASSQPKPAKLLFNTQDTLGYPYDQLVMGIDRSYAADNLRAVCDFRDDFATTMDWYKANTAEAKKVISEKGFVKIPLDLYLKARDYGRPESGNSNGASLEPMMDDLQSVDLLDKNQRVSVDELFIPNFTAGN